MDRPEELFRRIIIDPNVMVGKPIVKGTRLTVEHILGLLMEGISIDEILQDYPNLKREDIFACIAVAKQALQDSTFVPMSA